jgi:G3E family GTPase
LTARPLHFIAGFLGAAKTTLLNSILGLLAGRTVGVIVNEFGDVGVDSRLVEGGQAVLELCGGQIFCSCLSGSFLETLARLRARDVEVALVETSGLARPSTLPEILGGVERIGPGAYDYHGMITVVDAARFSRLSAVTPAAEEQVRFSQVVLLNKVDLVSDAAATALEERLRVLNPSAEIHRTVRCRVDSSILKPRRPHGRQPEGIAGWGDLGRPVALTVAAQGLPSRAR